MGNATQCGLSPLATQEINKSREKVNSDKEKVGKKVPLLWRHQIRNRVPFPKVWRVFPNLLFPHRVFHPLSSSLPHLCPQVLSYLVSRE